jgi:hypothetical protein
MGPNPSWQTSSCSATHEIPVILWNTKVHYRVNKYLQPTIILSQVNPVHNLPTYF